MCFVLCCPCRGECTESLRNRIRELETECKKLTIDIKLKEDQIRELEMKVQVMPQHQGLGPAAPESSQPSHIHGSAQGVQIPWGEEGPEAESKPFHVQGMSRGSIQTILLLNGDFFFPPKPSGLCRLSVESHQQDFSSCQEPVASLLITNHKFH